jgi:hypothetical protein
MQMVEKIDAAGNRLDEFQKESATYLQNQESDKNQLNKV